MAVDGKQCIKVKVEGGEHPYYAYGRAYIRVGDEDRQLSAKELENLILAKNRDRLRWDTEVCDKATLDDISAGKLKSFLKLCGLTYDTIPNSLEKLNLVKDGKLLNAAVLCFARKPEKLFPNARLRCASFGTLDTTVTLDMKDFYGDVFALISKAEEYILEHINIGMRLDGLLRVDVPEIDKEAFVKPLSTHSVIGTIGSMIPLISPFSKIGSRSGVPASSMADLPLTASERKWFQPDVTSCWPNCFSAVTGLRNGGVGSR